MASPSVRREITNETFPRELTHWSYYDVFSFNKKIMEWLSSTKRAKKKETENIEVLFVGDARAQAIEIIGGRIFYEILGINVELQATRVGDDYNLDPPERQKLEPPENLTKIPAVVIVCDYNSEVPKRVGLMNWQLKYVKKFFTDEYPGDVLPWKFVLGLNYDHTKHQPSGPMAFSRSIKAEYWHVPPNDRAKLLQFLDRVAALSFQYNMRLAYKKRSSLGSLVGLIRRLSSGPPQDTDENPGVIMKDGPELFKAPTQKELEKAAEAKSPPPNE